MLALGAATYEDRWPVQALPAGRGLARGPTFGLARVRISGSPEPEIDAGPGDTRGLRRDPCWVTSTSRKGGNHMSYKSFNSSVLLRALLAGGAAVIAAAVVWLVVAARHA